MPEFEEVGTIAIAFRKPFYYPEEQRMVDYMVISFSEIENKNANFTVVIDTSGVVHNFLNSNVLYARVSKKSK